MSQLRKRYRVAWDDGDTVEITTNAFDMSAAQDHHGDQLLQTLAVVHHALERQGHLPPPVPKFAEVLDRLDLLDGQGQVVTDAAQLEDDGPPAATEVGPTKPGRGRGAPSRSPS
jgi:hypothetical protein